MAQAASTGSGTLEIPLGQPPMPPLERGHREKLVEIHTSFGELLTFFCKNTTIHGTIRLVCSSPNRLKKVSWGLLLLGTLGMLYWQLGLLLEQYWRYPVIMAVSIHSERKLFPSVTLCDMNPQRPGSLHYHLEALDAFAQESIYSLYKFNFTEGRDTPFPNVPDPKSPFKLDRGIQLQWLKHLGNQHKVGFKLCNSTGGDCFYRTYSSGVTAAQEWYHFHYLDILGLTPTAREDSHHSHFVLSCRYNSEDCQAQHFRKFHHPTYGSCYTFEGVCTAQHPGITHKINLILRTEPRVGLPLLSTEADIKVMIHGHNHTPFLEHRGFSVRPGTETTIGIREDEVRRLGSPYSRCTDGAVSVDVPLLYNSSYTRQACLMSCFQQLMVESCSCGYFLHPLPAGAQYCSRARHPAWGHCFYRLHQALETHRLSCDSRCPRPCRETSYKLSTTTSRWPSAKSADWVLDVLRGETPSLSLSPGRSQAPRSHEAKVNIFYQELNYHMVDEAPVYSVPQLLSAMGSLWSLWFGSSVLSVIELLELLLDATALTLLLGFRWLHGAQVSQPETSTVSVLPCTSPAARGCGTKIRDPGHPVVALERVLMEELG